MATRLRGIGDAVAGRVVGRFYRRVGGRLGPVFGDVVGVGHVLDVELEGVLPGGFALVGRFGGGVGHGSGASNVFQPQPAVAGVDDGGAGRRLGAQGDRGGPGGGRGEHLDGGAGQELAYGDGGGGEGEGLGGEQAAAAQLELGLAGGGLLDQEPEGVGPIVAAGGQDGGDGGDIRQRGAGGDGARVLVGADQAAGHGQASRADVGDVALVDGGHPRADIDLGQGDGVGRHGRGYRGGGRGAGHGGEQEVVVGAAVQVVAAGLADQQVDTVVADRGGAHRDRLHRVRGAQHGAGVVRRRYGHLAGGHVDHHPGRGRHRAAADRRGRPQGAEQAAVLGGRVRTGLEPLGNVAGHGFISGLGR